MSSCRDEAHDSALKPGAASPTIGPQPTFGMDTAHDPSLHGVGCAVESARRPGGLAKPGARARTESRLRGTGSSAIVSRGPAAGQLRTHSGSHCSCACTPQTGIVRPGGGGGGPRCSMRRRPWRVWAVPLGPVSSLLYLASVRSSCAAPRCRSTGAVYYSALVCRAMSSAGRRVSLSGVTLGVSRGQGAYTQHSHNMSKTEEKRNS